MACHDASGTALHECGAAYNRNGACWQCDGRGHVGDQDSDGDGVGDGEDLNAASTAPVDAAIGADPRLADQHQALVPHQRDDGAVDDLVLVQPRWDDVLERDETLEIRTLNNARGSRARKGKAADLGFKPTSIVWVL